MNCPRATEAEIIYEERLGRIRRTIALEPVDRIPFVFMGTAFAPRLMGVSMAEFCSDPDVRVDTTLDAMDRLGGAFDGINALPAGRITAVLSLVWLSRVAVPGRDLPEDSLWQVDEAEIMTVDDYDTIIERGMWPFLMEYLPRIIDTAEIEAHLTWTRANLSTVVRRFRERGYVPVSSGGTTIPFECLCGGRSLQEFYLDLHRIPDKVKAALDVMQPDLIRVGVEAARQSGIPAVWVGGWRSASAMLSPKMWNAFVFPYFLEMVTRLAEEGVVSVLHFDHDWTRDLGRLRELPAKQCILNLDGWTDIRRAKEILGDHMAIMGDVPFTLLTTGTPDEVYTYVRDLARDLGPTGLILCPGCDAPVDARPENMRAFVEASLEFGKV
jgi:uroporphyrinogen-III decarboxylase